MAYILSPTSASNQVYTFEDLILSYYHKTQQHKACEWSPYLNSILGTGDSATGSLENKQARYLIIAGGITVRQVEGMLCIVSSSSEDRHPSA